MSQAILIDDTVDAGDPWSAIVPNQYYLTIVDLHGNQGVDFLCYNADQPEERYHAANTIKAIQTLKLTTGHVLYSDVARPLMHIVDDRFGAHDTIGGCCSAPSNENALRCGGCPRLPGKFSLRALAARHGTQGHRRQCQFFLPCAGGQR